MCDNNQKIDVGKYKIIAAILDPKPRFFVPKWLRKCEFLIDGEVYTGRHINHDFNGFYDFLRSHMEIVGIRMTLFSDDENRSMLYSLKSGIGIKIIDIHHNMPSFEIYNGPISSYRSEDSCDQFFDCNYILKNTSGNYAMTFGLSCLPPDEIQEIESWCENSR